MEEQTIIICDDNLEEIQCAEDILRESGLCPEKEYQIIKYTSAGQLLSDCKCNCVKADIIFMDIELAQESGIKAAEQINAIWPQCDIVYLTNYLQYAVDVYETKHLYYILKSEMRERLPRVWEKMRQSSRQKDEKVQIVLKNSGTLLVRTNEIYYAERRGRTTIIYLQDRKAETITKLDELEQLWGGCQFVKCHNSFLINMNQIVLYKRDSVEMKNGFVVPISRKYQKMVKEVFMQWSRKQLF